MRSASGPCRVALASTWGGLGHAATPGRRGRVVRHCLEGEELVSICPQSLPVLKCLSDLSLLVITCHRGDQLLSRRHRRWSLRSPHSVAVAVFYTFCTPFCRHFFFLLLFFPCTHCIPLPATQKAEFFSRALTVFTSIVRKP